MKKKIYAIYISIVLAVFSMFFIGFNAKASEYKGIAVPNTGTVESVYFNTNLSKEEIIEIIKPLNYVQGEGYNYFLCNKSDNTDYIIIAIDNVENPTIVSIYRFNNGTIEIIYDSDNVMEMNVIGWNSDITYPLTLNYELSSVFESFSVGTQNELLSSLFSITPFEEKETEQKEYFYQGTVVPNEGFIEKVYFNINLTLEEVAEMLEGLEYILDPTGTGAYFYCLAADGNMTTFIQVMKMHYVDSGDPVYQVYYITPEETTYLLQYKPITKEIDILGTSELSLNLDSATSTLASQFGQTMQNEKLVSMFSMTPFEKIYYKDVVEWQGTAIPNSGYVEKVYVNTNLMVDEVISLISQLTYTGGAPAVYVVYANENTSQMIHISYVGGEDYFISYNGTPIVGNFRNDYVDEGIVGWKEDFNGVCELNGNAIIEIEGISIGTQNELLSSLFSTTPFRAVTKSENMSNDKSSTNNPVKIDLSISNIDFNIKHLIGISSTSVLVYGLYKVLTMKRGKKYAKKFKR